jgi:hypothetical protein
MAGHWPAIGWLFCGPGRCFAGLFGSAERGQRAARALLKAAHGGVNSMRTTMKTYAWGVISLVLTACGGVDGEGSAVDGQDPGTVADSIHRPPPDTAPPPVGASDPKFADLVPVGPVEFYDSPNAGYVMVRILVSNAGNADTISVNGTLTFSYHDYPATLDTLAGNAFGYIYAEVPAVVDSYPSVQQCATYYVQIDKGRTMQRQLTPDDYSVYTNDDIKLDSQCLIWSQPITLDLRMRYALPERSLEDIVSSKVKASNLGLCSDCHSSGPHGAAVIYPKNYHPPVAHGSSNVVITSDMVINGYSWDGKHGSTDDWVSHFTNPNVINVKPNGVTKPPGLIAAFTQWKANGSKP